MDFSLSIILPIIYFQIKSLIFSRLDVDDLCPDCRSESAEDQGILEHRFLASWLPISV